MSIVSVALLKQWASPDMGLGRDAELQLCLDAAVAWLESSTGYRLAQASRTLILDGARAEGEGGDVLFIPRYYPGVIHLPANSVNVVVKENGTTLTVATGYSTTAGVLLRGANERAETRLIRYGGPWVAEYQNIEVTFKSGYAVEDISGSSPAAKQLPPADLQHLIRELAWLTYMSPNWIGKGSETKSGQSMTWEKSLTPASKRLFDLMHAAAW